jgi:hypothetical protein
LFKFMESALSADEAKSIMYGNAAAFRGNV